MPSNVLLLYLKQTFPSMIWIFIEGEGDGMESRLPFKVFSFMKNFGFTYQSQIQVFTFCLEGREQQVKKVK